MQAEYCLFFDERLLCALSRIHMLQVMVWGSCALDSYPCCDQKFVGLGNKWFYVKIWTVWLSVNEKLLIRKQEADIVVLSLRKPNCLLNIVTFCQCPLSFLSVLCKYLSHLLDYKHLKHQVALSAHREARSVTGNQKFRVSCAADYKPNLIFFFNFSHPPHLLFVSIFWEWSFDLPS